MADPESRESGSSGTTSDADTAPELASPELVESLETDGTVPQELGDSTPRTATAVPAEVPVQESGAEVLALAGGESPPATEAEILAPAGGERRGITEPLTAIQWAGMILAGGVGLIIACVTVGLLLVWWGMKPPPIVLPTSMVDANGQISYPITDTNVLTVTGTLINQYRTLNEVALDGPTKLFEQIVVKAFLPIFTLILGYIFGSRTAEREARNNSSR